MDKTLVLLDAGFLSKISRNFGKGKYLEYDIVSFASNIAKKQNLLCERVFYFTAPPFQSSRPTEEESRRYKNYERFIKRLSKHEIITIREGRCQRLKFGDSFIYKQKAVDSLVIIDLINVPIQYPNIRKIILVASDSDFVPVVELLDKRGIKIILYTYYEKGRDAL